jgi:hypothetical protein
MIPKFLRRKAKHGNRVSRWPDEAAQQARRELRSQHVPAFWVGC